MTRPGGAGAAGDRPFAAPEGKDRPGPIRWLDRAEQGVACLLFLCGVAWLLVMLILGGPPWRDELSSIFLAESPSLKGLWENLGYDSCPLLWPLLLRGWLSLGMQGGLQVRALGFVLGVCLLASPWWVARVAGRRIPILSTALLAFSPAFLFAVSSLRAYGVGSLMLVWTVGLTLRGVERATTARLLSLAAVTMAAAHSLYTSPPFLLAILSAGILALVRRRRWKPAACVLGIGCLAAGSLVIYRQVVSNAAESIGLFQIPIDIPWIAASVGQALGSAGPYHVLGWAMLTLVGIWLSVRALQGSIPMAGGKDGAAPFFLAVLLAAPALYGATLLRIKVPTQAWYYAPLMAVAAVALDGLLGNVRFPSWARIGRMLLAVLLAVSSVPYLWQEVHTRRTNMDLAARELALNAGPNDLIIVDPFYFVTSFKRYYTGKSRWMTLPPVKDTRGGGYGFVKQAMMQEEPLQELFSAVAETFQAGNRVWIVGGALIIDPKDLPPPPPPPPNGPLGWNHNPYSYYWTLRLGAFLFGRAGQIVQFSTDPGMLVNPFERVSLLRFSPP